MFEGVTNRRKNTTPWWKVLPAMLVIGILVGIRTCNVMGADEEDRARREQLAP